MKKLIYSLFITICTSILFFSFNCLVYIKPFNNNSVMKNINHLSSNNFKGRLPGTLENTEAAFFVRNEFKNSNLKPYCKDYFQTFSTYHPSRIKGSPCLKILDINGKTIKSFSYFTEYKEDMLNFAKNSCSFNKSNVNKHSKDYMLINDENNKFLFFVPQNNKLCFRSSFYTKTPYSMCIMVTKDTMSQLQKYLNGGYSIDCFVPYNVQKSNIRNVIGYIKGKNQKSSPVVLSAHFDHVGSDLNGTVYNGALDNASGMSFVIEMSRYISSLGQPDRDIVFAGFNAEEFGCLGSTEFVSKFKQKLKGSHVFNFDMIGSDNGVPLCIMGGKKDSVKSPFIKSVSSTCNNQHIHFNYLFEDCSDHEPFRQNNIDAITFCDNDSSRIHTPMDKSCYISKSAMDRCFKVSSREIIKYAFSGNPILIYYKELIMISSALIIILSVLYVKFTSIKKRKSC